MMLQHPPAEVHDMAWYINRGGEYVHYRTSFVVLTVNRLLRLLQCFRIYERYNLGVVDLPVCTHGRLPPANDLQAFFSRVICIAGISLEGENAGLLYSVCSRTYCG